jgi:tetratricopeptide (TPR) repeat protein
MVAADSKAKFLHEAEKYILHGKVSQAIGEYLKIIKLDPNDVLTLNTIGDLYLRQHNIPEANKCFAQVAETYVRNNFFLKAIAVYRKILSTDPSNLQTNATIAALYAKQGSSVDARNQYLKVAALLEKADRGKEVLDVYEKIVELDPSNSTAQRKLAELHLAAGDNSLYRRGSRAPEIARFCRSDGCFLPRAAAGSDRCGDAGRLPGVLPGNPESGASTRLSDKSTRS